MTIVVSKGQPFRFGVRVDSEAISDSSTIRFVSEPPIEQVKSISPISLVEIDKAYVSVEMSMAMHILSEFSSFEQFTASSGLWQVLVSSRPLLIMLRRRYLLNLIKRTLPKPATLIEIHKQNLDRRMILRDLEAGMTRTIAKPRIIPLIIRSQGWNSRLGKLFAELYQPWPVGSLSHKGIYQRSEYPPISSHSNISDGDDKLASLGSCNGIAIIFIDELRLSSGHSWPDVLQNQVSPHLMASLGSARLVIIDNPKDKKKYEKSLGLNLHDLQCTVGSLMPLPPQIISDALANTRVLAFCSDSIKPYGEVQSNIRIQPADYSCFINAFRELYPNPTEGNLGTSAALQDALRIYKCSDLESDPRIRFEDGFRLPATAEDQPGIARLVFGSLAHLIRNLFLSSSRTILLRSSDLGAIEEIGIVIDESSLSVWDNSALLLCLKSSGTSLYRIEPKNLFILMRQLRDHTLENPYRLEKFLTFEQKAQAEMLRSHTRLLVMAIDLS